MSRKLVCNMFGDSALVLETLNCDSLGSLAIALREMYDLVWMPPALLGNLGRIPGNAFSAAAAQPWTIVSLALFQVPNGASPARVQSAVFA